MSGMGCRTTGNYHDLPDLPDLFVAHPKLLDYDLSVPDPRRKGICNCFWLFVHFL